MKRLSLFLAVVIGIIVATVLLNKNAQINKEKNATLRTIKSSPLSSKKLSEIVAHSKPDSTTSDRPSNSDSNQDKDSCYFIESQISNLSSQEIVDHILLKKIQLNNKCGADHPPKSKRQCMKAGIA